jgi:molybdopterin synthase sulfur carrier subunit
LRVKVSLMGELGKLAKTRPVAVEVPDGASLRSLILGLDQHTSSAISTAVLVDGERIASAYSVLRNGSNVLLGQGLETVLAEGDEVAVMPKVAGGSVKRESSRSTE